MSKSAINASATEESKDEDASTHFLALVDRVDSLKNVHFHTLVCKSPYIRPKEVKGGRKHPKFDELLMIEGNFKLDENDFSNIGKGSLVEITKSRPRKAPKCDRLTAESSVISLKSSSEALLTKIYSFAEKIGIHVQFNETGLKETKRISEKRDEIINNPNVLDLTNLCFFAMDNPDSRDIDQAMCYEKIDSKNKEESEYIVWYALADTSSFISPEMTLYEESFVRGASYYGPGISWTMLPRELCEDVISLIEGETRLAMVWQMHLDNEGHLLSTALHRAKIVNHHQLDYGSVNSYLLGTKKIEFKDPRLVEQLALFKEVGIARRILARDRGVVDHAFQDNLIFNSAAKEGSSKTTSKLVEKVKDDCLTLEHRNSYLSERYNAEISILCNVAAARFLKEGICRINMDMNFHDKQLESFGIYKAHKEPSKSRIRKLKNQIKDVIKLYELPNDWHWSEDEALNIFLERISEIPKNEEERCISEVIQMQAIYINERAVFSDVPKGHYGLKLDVYGRVTAPMREAVGIVSHLICFEQLNFMKIVRSVTEHSLNPTFDELDKLWTLMVLKSIDGYPDDPSHKEFVKEVNDISSTFNHLIPKQNLDKLFSKLKELPYSSEKSKQAVVNVIGKAIDAANKSKQKQHDLDKMLHSILMEQYFGKGDESKDSSDEEMNFVEKKTFQGFVSGLSKGKIHVLLEDIQFNVKVYINDLPQIKKHEFNDSMSEVTLHFGDSLKTIKIAQKVFLNPVCIKRKRYVFDFV